MNGDNYTPNTPEVSPILPPVFNPNSPAPALPSKPKKNVFKIVLLIFSYLILLGVIGYLGYYENSRQKDAKIAADQISTLEAKIKTTENELSELKDSTGTNDIDKDAFQAVFLKSGQVYFGKITKLTENQITLRNIYYLRVNGTETPNLDALPTDTSLIKLGDEMHGPQDVMYIERKEVEFWENLKTDGAVAKAIIDYEKSTPN